MVRDICCGNMAESIHKSQSFYTKTEKRQKKKSSIYPYTHSKPLTAKWKQNPTFLGKKIVCNVIVSRRGNGNVSCLERAVQINDTAAVLKGSLGRRIAGALDERSCRAFKQVLLAPWNVGPMLFKPQAPPPETKLRPRRLWRRTVSSRKDTAQHLSPRMQYRWHLWKQKSTKNRRLGV